MKACEEYLENYKATITDPKSFCDGWRKALEWSENQFLDKSAFEADEAINKELRD